MNLLIGVTGSVAAIKLTKLIENIKDYYKHKSVDIRIVVTKNALPFLQLSEISYPIYQDEDEWHEWKEIGDPILHIDLRNWADVFLIAPLDANSLAKISNGICDNLLTCIVRAWDPTKRLIVCPAMNTFMWEHPITEKQLAILEEWGILIIYPIEKKLACGDIGIGAMENTDEISKFLYENT